MVYIKLLLNKLILNILIIIYTFYFIIYGVKVNNLLNLNKDRIFAVFASGTQQLIKDKEILEQQVEILENKVQTLEDTVYTQN